MLLLPVLLPARALNPVAVLLSPVLLPARALNPVAVLFAPTVLLLRALHPVAVLSLPVVLTWRVIAPMAVFSLPELGPSLSAPSPNPLSARPLLPVPAPGEKVQFGQAACATPPALNNATAKIAATENPTLLAQMLVCFACAILPILPCGALASGLLTART